MSAVVLVPEQVVIDIRGRGRRRGRGPEQGKEKVRADEAMTRWYC